MQFLLKRFIETSGATQFVSNRMLQAINSLFVYCKNCYKSYSDISKTLNLN